MLYDLVQDVFEDSFGVIAILCFLSHTKDVSALADEVLQVCVLAFIGQLGESYFFLRELVIQVEEFEGGVG